MGRGGEGIMPTYSFSSVSPERLELKPLNFLTFSFNLILKKKLKKKSKI